MIMITKTDVVVVVVVVVVGRCVRTGLSREYAMTRYSESPSQPQKKHSQK